MPTPWFAEKAPHPEPCPKCGALTWTWKWLQSRMWVQCEHCGFEDAASGTPGFRRA